MKQIQITEARKVLFSLPASVNGDPISIVRHGRPILVAMKPEVFMGIHATIGIYASQGFRDQVTIGAARAKGAKMVTASDAKRRIGLAATSGVYEVRTTEEALVTLERMKDEEMRGRLVEALGTAGLHQTNWLPLTHDLAGYYGVRLPFRHLAVISVDSNRRISVLGVGALPASMTEGYGLLETSR